MAGCLAFPWLQLHLLGKPTPDATDETNAEHRDAEDGGGFGGGGKSHRDITTTDIERPSCLVNEKADRSNGNLGIGGCVSNVRTNQCEIGTERTICADDPRVRHT